MERRAHDVVTLRARVAPAVKSTEPTADRRAPERPRAEAAPYRSAEKLPWNICNLAKLFTKSCKDILIDVRHRPTYE